MRGQQIMSILIIAGSDSIAGAGMQADLKTAAAFGVYAATAVTALTAQNTMSFTMSQPASAEMMRAQLDAIISDIDIAAVKIGMLPDAATTEVVADFLEEHNSLPVVLDPVRVTSTGAELGDEGALEVLNDRILSRSRIVTPNLFEARVLAQVAEGEDVTSEEMAQCIFSRGARAVLIKGGHANAADDADPSLSVDRLFLSDGRSMEFESARREGEFHGTGCTLSTAIACGISQGKSLGQAVARAHNYLAVCIAQAEQLGHGSYILKHMSEESIRVARHTSSKNRRRFVERP